MRTHLRAGFTLVELMVAMALTLFIMVILSQAFVLSLETFSAMKGLGDMQINLRVATSLLRDDLSQDHFEGKRRLSDMNSAGQPLIVVQPPQAGFFAVLQPTAVGAGPGYVAEGIDTNGLASYRANNHVLYMTVKRRGNRQENFFTASVPGPPAAFFAQNTAYDVLPANLAYDTLTQPNTPFYSSQWAEVMYFLVQVGSTEEPYNATSTLGTPTFALYRAQWVMVPDGTNVSGKFKAALATTTYQNLSCGPNKTGTLDFYSPADAAGLNPNAPPTVKRVYQMLAGFTPNNGRSAITQTSVALVLPSVISFQIQVMRTGATTFGDVPLYDTTTFSAPAAVNAAANTGLKAIQITLRVWDNKTRQTRQVTIVQDL